MACWLTLFWAAWSTLGKETTFSVSTCDPRCAAALDSDFAALIAATFATCPSGVDFFATASSALRLSSRPASRAACFASGEIEPTLAARRASGSEMPSLRAAFDWPFSFGLFLRAKARHLDEPLLP